MSKPGPNDFGNLSMFELFRSEVETQSAILTQELLALEKNENVAQNLKELMRAAHSLKGASRIVDRKSAVRIAHAMEDCFVAAQQRKCSLPAEVIDVLLTGIDLLNRNAQAADDVLSNWENAHQNEIEGFLTSLSALSQVLDHSNVDRSEPTPAARLEATDEEIKRQRVDSAENAIKEAEVGNSAAAVPDRTLRVNADSLDRLLGLAGEGFLAARWLESFSAEMLRLKRLHSRVGRGFEALREMIPATALDERTNQSWSELRNRVADYQRSLAERLLDLDEFDRHFANFSRRLYHDVLDCRMRPFADGVQGFQRMVRDLARSLGKVARLEVEGESTPVGRDILEKLKAPLNHLLRNSLDHGIESSAERRQNGKSDEGTVKLNAYHSAGLLLIVVADDGRGIDVGAIRNAVIRKNLNSPDATNKMSEAELFEFLFLPGFTLKDTLSDMSGRGVGLDVVQTMVKGVGGRVRVSSRRGYGTLFQLELPISLSVLRTLLVEIAGEFYAFPLARVHRALKLPREQIESLEGRQHFQLEEEQVGLVSAHQVLELDEPAWPTGYASIVVLGGRGFRFGLVVDRFLGQRELIVRPLDPRLGKVKNCSAAALMPDGAPVLIMDVDDLQQSIENLASHSRLSQIRSDTKPELSKRQKYVLIVDDSLTVRELERKLLERKGYRVNVAVDGIDGWNAVRTGQYDLVVTDVDMPRMDGVELLKLIRQDSRLKTLPVMIVSYKDRQEDRRRGLEAGADYYLTKASFQDETLVRVVTDLIGKAEQ
jgi:two-component system sensor histidine kinase and response regulator WspE